MYNSLFQLLGFLKIILLYVVTGLVKVIRFSKRIVLELPGVIKRWPELWSVPIACFIFILSPFVIWIFSPGAGSYDLGIIQRPILAGACMIFFNGLVFLALKFNWFSDYHYYKETKTEPNLTSDFKNLTAWQRSLLFSVRFLFLFWLLVEILKAI
jgi:hypothetical protein